MKQLNRKLYNMMIGVLFCAFQMIPLALIAQEEEMPITTSSDEALKLFLEGRDNFELLEYVASAQYSDQAIKKDSNFALAYLYRFRSGIGGAEITQQYLKKAVELADKVSKGEKYLILYYKAQVDVDGVKQKECLDTLLKLFPSDKRVQYLAGLYFQLTERDFLTALEYHKRVTEIDKKYAPVYNMIGYCNFSLSNYEEAEKAFKKQIKLVPERPNPYDSYGELLLKMGRYDESIKQYKIAFEKDDSFTNALAGVGDNYIFKGEYETAREYYHKCFDKAPNLGGKFGALDKMASSYVLKGKIKKALNTYEKYRALAKENNRIGNVIASYQSEGFILSETGNTVDGLKRYQKALKIASETDTPEPIKTNRIIAAKFMECWALLSNKNIEEALTKMEELSKIAEKRQVPSDTRWMNWLNGLVESNNGNFRQAVELYSKSWPKIILVKYYIAVAYKKMGDQEKADEMFKEFEKWNQANLQFALVLYRMKNIDNK